MFVSEDRRGSVILEVDGGRMDVAFLDDQGSGAGSLHAAQAAGHARAGAETRRSAGAGRRAEPFVRETTVQWSVPARARRASASGRDGGVVRTLADGETEAGVQRADWDGRDDAGAPVGAGVYFVTLEHGGSLRAAEGRPHAVVARVSTPSWTGVRQRGTLSAGLRPQRRRARYR